jgi:hypothetical protein
MSGLNLFLFADKAVQSANPVSQSAFRMECKNHVVLLALKCLLKNVTVRELVKKPNQIQHQHRHYIAEGMTLRISVHGWKACYRQMSSNLYKRNASLIS